MIIPFILIILDRHARAGFVGTTESEHKYYFYSTAAGSAGAAHVTSQSLETKFVWMLKKKTS